MDLSIWVDDTTVDGSGASCTWHRLVKTDIYLMQGFFGVSQHSFISSRTLPFQKFPHSQTNQRYQSSVNRPIPYERPVISPSISTVCTFSWKDLPFPMPRHWKGVVPLKISCSVGKTSTSGSMKTTSNLNLSGPSKGCQIVAKGSQFTIPSV